MIIIPVEEAALLLAVHRVVGGVEVEDQVLGRGAMGGDELVDQDLGAADQGRAIDAVLEAAEGGRRGERGVVAGRQLTALADRLPGYETNILRKVNLFKPTGESAFAKASQVVADVAKSLDKPPVERDDVKDVRVVAQPTFQERLRGAVGPYLGILGVGSLVLVLVLFLLMNREDLGDRIVQLFGERQIGLTTRTMDEVGQRI